MRRFTVEGSGGNWAVLDDGVAVRQATSWWKAESMRTALERQARRKARACIRCTTEFMSDGPHHRMCAACRKLSD